METITDGTKVNCRWEARVDAGEGSGPSVGNGGGPGNRPHVAESPYPELGH